METYKKQYTDTEEYTHRQAIFEENLAYIESHNSRSDSSRLAVGKFADLTHEEYKAMLGGIKRQNMTDPETLDVSGLTRKDSVDWSETKYAPHQLDIGTTCLASWAYAATLATGYSHSIYEFWDEGTDYSVQQVIDCTYKYHDGCDHGWPGDAFDYLAAKLSCMADDYPFRGDYGECQYSSEVCRQPIVNNYMFIGTTSSPNAFKNGVSLKPSTVTLDAEC